MILHYYINTLKFHINKLFELYIQFHFPICHMQLIFQFALESFLNLHSTVFSFAFWIFILWFAFLHLHLPTKKKRTQTDHFHLSSFTLFIPLPICMCCSIISWIACLWNNLLDYSLISLLLFLLIVTCEHPSVSAISSWVRPSKYRISKIQ